MKPTTGLALLAAALSIAAAAPAAASPGKQPPGGSTSPPGAATSSLAKMLHIDFIRDREPEKTTGNGKGNNGNGKGNDGDNIPNGKAWGWWRHHGPHPVSP